MEGRAEAECVTVELGEGKGLLERRRVLEVQMVALQQAARGG